MSILLDLKINVNGHFNYFRSSISMAIVNFSRKKSFLNFSRQGVVVDMDPGGTPYKTVLWLGFLMVTVYFFMSSILSWYYVDVVNSFKSLEIALKLKL